LDNWLEARAEIENGLSDEDRSQEIVEFLNKKLGIDNIEQF